MVREVEVAKRNPGRNRLHEVWSASSARYSWHRMIKDMSLCWEIERRCSNAVGFEFKIRTIIIPRGQHGNHMPRNLECIAANSMISEIESTGCLLRCQPAISCLWNCASGWTGPRHRGGAARAVPVGMEVSFCKLCCRTGMDFYGTAVIGSSLHTLCRVTRGSGGWREENCLDCVVET